MQSKILEAKSRCTHCSLIPELGKIMWPTDQWRDEADITGGGGQIGIKISGAILQV